MVPATFLLTLILVLSGNIFGTINNAVVVAESVTLFLHEEVNFQGNVREISLRNRCHPIPVPLINKIASVRAVGCAILFENDDCQTDSGTTLRLSPAAPTRPNLKAHNFNLGSAKPCSMDVSQDESFGPIPIPVPSGEESDIDYNDDKVRLELDISQIKDENDTSLYHSTRKSQEEADYGERIDTDNEPGDGDDFRNPDIYSSSQRTISIVLDDSDGRRPPESVPESPLNSTLTDSAGVDPGLTIGEVPFPRERRNESKLTPESIEIDIDLDKNHDEGENIDITASPFDPSPTSTSTTSSPNPNVISTTTNMTKEHLTTTTPSFDCSPPTRCRSIDKYGSHWEVCPSLRGTLTCPGNSSGLMSWECGSSGIFLESQPIYENCSSEWIEELNSIVDQQLGGGSISNPPFEPSNVLAQIRANINPEASALYPGKDSQPNYFGHEIGEIVRLVESTVEKSPLIVTSFQQYENVSEEAIKVFNELLSHKDQWSQLNQTSRAQLATQLIDSVETTMFSLGKVAGVLNKAGGPYEKVFEDSSENFRIVTGYVKKSDLAQNQNVLDTSLQALQAGVNFPSDWSTSVSGETIRFVGLKLDYNYASQLFPGNKNRFSNSATLGSEIVGVSLANEMADKPVNVEFSGQGLKMAFNIKEVPIFMAEDDGNASGGNLHPVCVFWDPQILEWSKDGCRLVKSDSNNALCECQHLTLFAVLLDAHGYTNYVKDAKLYLLTIILCSLSTVCLLVTIVTLKVLRSAKSPSTSTTIQLCFCLLVANILVMTVLDRNAFNLNNVTCSAAALTLHYFLLCAFTWMAIEGFIVLKMVLDVFDTGTGNKVMLTLVGYGLPLLIVASLGVVHFLGIQTVYGGQMYCWLEGFYMLAFIGPVIIVVLGNGVALAVAIRVACQAADKEYADQRKRKIKSYRTWIVGTSALTSILGLTWIFGFLLLIGDRKLYRIASYIFTIFNASQGIFVFMFHCIFNRNVRAAFRARFATKNKISVASRSDSHGAKGEGIGSNSTTNTGSHSLSNASSQGHSHKRRLTQLSSIPAESEDDEKKQIQVNVEKDDSSDADEIEAKKRFLRSRSDSDDLSRKPAFFKYLSENPDGKSDLAFM